MFVLFVLVWHQKTKGDTCVLVCVIKNYLLNHRTYLKKLNIALDLQVNIFKLTQIKLAVITNQY